MRGPLPGAERDDAADRIVGRDSHGHTIARDHLDVEPAQAAADARQELVTLITLNTEVTAGECLDHLALNLDEIVSCHAKTFPCSPGSARV